MLDDAVSFYESLLGRLETTFQISVTDLVEKPSPFRNEGLSRIVRMALVSAQKCLIALGDIARFVRARVVSFRWAGRVVLAFCFFPRLDR